MRSFEICVCVKDPRSSSPVKIIEARLLQPMSLEAIQTHTNKDGRI